MLHNLTCVLIYSLKNVLLKMFSRGLLNHVPYVPRVLPAVVPYVLRALLALVPYVPRALRALMLQVPQILHVPSTYMLYLLLTTLICNLY